MAKKFVRKDTDIRWIQEIRDWTNDIGDILVKDDRYGYLRTYGEYKPITFPMVWDYKGIPKNEITKTDYFVDKTGVHKFDKKKNTTHKYDLVDGSIDENRTIADDNNNPLNKIDIHQDKNIYDYKGKILDHLYELKFDNDGYDFTSIYNGTDSNKTRYYRQYNNSSGMYTAYNMGYLNYSQSIAKSGYNETYTTNTINNTVIFDTSQSYINLTNYIDNKNLNYSFTMNTNGITKYLVYDSDMIFTNVEKNHESIMFSGNGDYYDFGLRDGLFYTNGSEKVINSLKDYYDTLLGVTAKYNDALAKISALQTKMNSVQTKLDDLQNQINDLKNKA